MIKSKLGNNNLLLILGGFFFVSALILHASFERPTFDIEMQDRALNIDKDLLRIFSLGNKRTISSVLWVQTLMESDHQHYIKNDRKNWMYLRFDTISTLDPLFYHNYLWGGTYLSIIKDDMLAAAEIFDKGLTYYPEDFELNYRQGFNYYFELGDFEKGLHYLEKILDHPKTHPSLKFIISKLKFETTKNYDVAIEFLTSMIRSEKDEGFTTKLKADLYALRAQRDLECLNNKQGHCSYIDAQGKPYIKDGDTWKAEIDFKPYKIFLRDREK